MIEMEFDRDCRAVVSWYRDLSLTFLVAQDGHLYEEK